MAAADIGNLVGGVTVARSDFAQIFARHAIESVDGCAMVARGGKQFVEWSPIVSPIKLETYALAKFGFVNLAAKPLFEDVLVARKDCFHSKHYGTMPAPQVAKQRGWVAL